MKNNLTAKKPQSESPRGKYNERLTVKGSFLDIIKASVKDANDKTAEKKKKKEKDG